MTLKAGLGPSNLPKGAKNKAEAACEDWLGEWLSGRTASLRRGRAAFAAAVGDSSYRQAKVALVDLLSQVRSSRAGTEEAVFRALKPVMVKKARRELSGQEQEEELAQLEAGKLKVEVHVEIPKEIFELAADVQREALGRILGDPEASVRCSSERTSRSMLARRAERAREVQGRRDGLLDQRQWASFIGRVTSNALTEDESAVLDVVREAGIHDASTEGALELSGLLDRLPEGRAWAGRVSAALALARRARTGQPLGAVERAALGVIGGVDPAPSFTFVPPRTTKEGDLESWLFRWFSLHLPHLATAMLLDHPMILRGAQFHALCQQCDAIRAEQGPFLTAYNVLTVMHQSGGVPGWLELLRDRLGLVPERYLGVAVPYSSSEIAVDRLNLDGFETLQDHDPRDPSAALIEDKLGAGNPRGFDELKQEDLVRAISRMLKMHEENGKPILVIDDGGYVAKTLRAHFPEHEHKFKIVEWTTRGVRNYEQVEDPGFAYVSAAEARPKVELEPAFIADACISAFLAWLHERLGSLDGRHLTVVGAGNIGLACAKAALEQRARVTMFDVNLEKARHGAQGNGLLVADRIESALVTAEAVLLGTGANSMPPERFSALRPGTWVASLSSADIETRSPRAFENGTWDTDLLRLSIKLGAPTGESSAADWQPSHPVNQAGLRALDETLSEVAALYGLEATVEGRAIASGGYPINLIRRLRLMSPAREELIFLNVTEAIAQIDGVQDSRKRQVEPWREDRVIDLFREAHPEDYARARAFS